MAVTPIDVPVSKKPKRRGRGRSTYDEGPPKPPEWQVPSQFPEHASSILKKQKISKKQFSRYVEQLSMFILTNFSADFAIALQGLIRSGDKLGMEMFAKSVGMIKNESGVVVNLQTNNNLNLQGGNDRGFDSIVRMLDDRDRKKIAAAQEHPVLDAIDVTAE